ncbi:flagellar biosynthesis protein FliQ [Ligilactobacillus acidipiscis DSM 15836]|jgi:flagellar biosynthetic protein FliQ|uniref:Flagellar biosynthetic protein FliQ n=2 Tax=Ligilactobacillus acidipiscis TaxID=89059 RepID=A0A0A7RGD8_9LACO|nr:flagellar biosynthesis protein FliQ [Ligilactobacillus acidipiscis]AJA33634.1 flagellar biosynthetic protein FliQ [Ligilactobacillus acidipiscis]KRM30185.1 flagellar biosynthesis protein FliQ [Ligilactobacillus acidipiscis DSM 15836]KRN88069.1 flagellar biosynthesis protein FliQ [Ligilactobacillus acidipiscis]MCI1924534.1 flagellar biosynthesis protein FliQ [Ligilactobacillus acidipiscis]MCI1953952.1 flagellar biosynthesis protein FliQ [Ligilactobacillus acidipiscis]
MSVSLVLTVMREAVIRILVVSGPIVIVAMVVGLVISIFQATTQIQEQTLSFVPKLVAIFVTLILAGNFMITTLKEFTEYIFRLISGM